MSDLTLASVEEAFQQYIGLHMGKVQVKYIKHFLNVLCFGLNINLVSVETVVTDSFYRDRFFNRLDHK